MSTCNTYIEKGRTILNILYQKKVYDTCRDARGARKEKINALFVSRNIDQAAETIQKSLSFFIPTSKINTSSIFAGIVNRRLQCVRSYDHKDPYARDQQRHCGAGDDVRKRVLRAPERLNHRDLQHEHGIQRIGEVEVAKRLHDKSAALFCF